MRSTIYSFLLILLAMIDRTLLLSNYLGNSFLQTEQPPKSEFPSHSSLIRYLVDIAQWPRTLESHSECLYCPHWHDSSRGRWSQNFLESSVSSFFTLRKGCWSNGAWMMKYFYILQIIILYLLSLEYTHAICIMLPTSPGSFYPCLSGLNEKETSIDVQSPYLFV